MNDRYQVCEELTAEEREALKADIEENGVRDPIEIDEEGSILDGHNRKEIADELGIPCPFEVIRGLGTDERKRDYARKRNCLRRQMTTEAKKKIAREMIETEPERSNRSIGRIVGMSHHTIVDLRNELGLPSGQSTHDQCDEEPAEESAPAHQWMNAAGWYPWHKLEAFSHLTGMGEEQKRVMDEILDERARHPKDALEMLERCAGFMARDRARLVGLWDSGETAKRALAVSKLAGTMPPPDSRLAPLTEMHHRLGQMIDLAGDEQERLMLERIDGALCEFVTNLRRSKEEW